MLSIENSAVLVFSNLVLRLSNGFDIKIKYFSFFSPAEIIAVLQKTLSTNHHLILKQKYDVVVEGEDSKNNVPLGKVMFNAYQIYSREF